MCIVDFRTKSCFFLDVKCGFSPISSHIVSSFAQSLSCSVWIAKSTPSCPLDWPIQREQMKDALSLHARREGVFRSSWTAYYSYMERTLMDTFRFAPGTMQLRYVPRVSAMKRCLSVSTGLFLLICVLLSLPSDAVGNEFEQKNTRLAAKLRAYFPHVRGTVVSVQDGRVFLESGSQQHILEGALFALLEDGTDIIHPETQEVLGTYEQLGGILQVTEVREQFSIARLISQEPGAEIISGTAFGAFPGNVKLAVLPLDNRTGLPLKEDVAYRTFLQALQHEDILTLFDKADIHAAAVQSGESADISRDSGSLPRIHSALHVHFFLRPVLQSVDDTFLLQATLLSEHGEDILTEQEIVHDMSFLQEPAVSHEAGHVSSSHRTFWQSDTLTFKAHKIAVGDLTGDGKHETVVATEHDLYVYAHDVLNQRDAFLPMAHIEGYNDELILDLSCGDVNRNGRQEVFVTSIRTVSSDVTVYEFHNGTFQEIWSTKGLALRVIHTPDRESLLVGQNTSASTNIEFLTGRVAEYDWDGTDYAKKKTLNIPRQVTLFGFTLADLKQDGTDEVLVYDQHDRLSVYQGNSRIWRTQKYEPYIIHLVRKKERESQGRDIRGRIETIRLQSENTVFLIVFENLKKFGIFRHLPVFQGSRLYVLRWDGSRFVEDMKTEDFDGYIVDYVIADVDNDTEMEVVMAMVLRSNELFKDPRSQISVYEFEENF